MKFCGLVSRSSHPFFKQLNLFVLQEVADTIDVCVDDEIVNYLNRPDVQKALHARLVGVRQWAVCST